MKKVICVLLICLLSMNLLCAASAETAAVTYSDKEVQFNLAGMSGTMVCSMIYNIVSEPSKFMGQIIRLSGYYSAWEDPNTGAVYHSCVIPDATACCAQGMEFVWNGEHAYPDDYPELGTDMIVTGRWESYMEGDYMYLHLTDAQVEWLAPQV